MVRHTYLAVILIDQSRFMGVEWHSCLNCLINVIIYIKWRAHWGLFIIIAIFLRHWDWAKNWGVHLSVAISYTFWVEIVYNLWSCLSNIFKKLVSTVVSGQVYASIQLPVPFVDTFWRTIVSESWFGSRSFCGLRGFTSSLFRNDRFL